MKKEKDPMGMAIADFHNTGKAGKLKVLSPDFDEDEIPVETLFRTFDEMPSIEQEALKLSCGKILDIGAGAGCHSIALQDMGKEVTAIDISPLSVITMKERGVVNAFEQDLWLTTEKYDTLLMLMNGIGIVGKIEKLPEFFGLVDKILNEGGQLLLDSSDLCYLYEEEDGIIILPDDGRYYGELRYQMRYKGKNGEPFDWLYIDFDSLQKIAAECGFEASMVKQGEHYDYLARITRAAK